VLIPEGLSDPNGLSVDRMSRLCIDSGQNTCTKNFVSKIRAILKKLPGFFFSGFPQTQYMATAVTTMEALAKLMIEHFKNHYSDWLKYNETIRDKGYSYGIPKERLLVSVYSSASKYDIELISLGLM